MNRSTRDAFAATTDQTDLAYGESACVETPPEFFAALNTGFHFQVDLTANEHNHLLPGWLGPGSPYQAYDALTAEWSRYGSRGFSNPPYGPFIPKILHKAVHEATKGFASAFLLPMRAGGWYTNIVLQQADYLWHLEPRLTFWYRGQPKPTAKVKWSRQFDTGIGYIKTSDGYVLDRATGQYLLQPANALFDSIIVVFKPRLVGPREPYQVRPRPWRWKEQDVRELMRPTL